MFESGALLCCVRGTLQQLVYYQHIPVSEYLKEVLRVMLGTDWPGQH